MSQMEWFLNTWRGTRAENRINRMIIAGMLLALTSEAVCFVLNALSFLAVIAAILRMRWPADVRSGTTSGW